MQVTLDQLLSMLMSRMEILEQSVEELRMRTNVLGIVLRKTDAMNKEDLYDAVQEHLFTLQRISGKKEAVPMEAIQQMTDQLWNWYTSNTQQLKEEMERFEKAMNETAQDPSATQNQRIQIASGPIPDLKQIRKR